MSDQYSIIFKRGDDVLVEHKFDTLADAALNLAHNLQRLSPTQAGIMLATLLAGSNEALGLMPDAETTITFLRTSGKS